MESLFFLVPAVLVFLAIAIRVLYWALNNGQYDNLNTEAHRILFDADDKPAPLEAASDTLEPAPSAATTEPQAQEPR